MAKQSFQVIAHRGANALAEHENTLEAFQIAIDLKADMAELDVRKTKDGELVVFHDAEIDGQQLSELSFRQLEQLAAGDGYRVPRFEEVLALCKNQIRLDIELKETGFEDRVVDMVCRRFGYHYEQFSVKSFLDEVSLRVKERDARVVTGLLVGRSKASFWTRLSEYFPEHRLKQCRADFISPYYQFVTQDFMRRMRRRGYPVYVWTLNDEDAMRKYAQRGVQAIITDRPDIAMQL